MKIPLAPATLVLFAAIASLALGQQPKMPAGPGLTLTTAGFADGAVIPPRYAMSDPNAVSPKQAQGLMQLIPDTALRFKVRNAMDPAQNIRGGMAYLRWLMAYFEGDVALVAAAYNAGERAVERYRGVPPYAETRDYVRRILAAVGTLAHPFDASVTAPSPTLPLMRVAGTLPLRR